jgi:hypothetical protein
MFAIFSTAPGEHLDRYSVFKRNGEKVEYVPIYGALYLESHEVDIDPVHTTLQTATGPVSTHYWYTGWDVINNGEVIPVYEYLNAHLIFPDVPKIKCQDDYPDWCSYRVQEQKIIYSSMIQMYGCTEQYEAESAPAPSAPPAPAKTIKNEEKLPNFVAEALIKAVKDAGTECSISMTPFRSCSKISVTNCYHCFDAESLDKWCKNKMICPMCKSVIKFISTV